MYTLKDHFKESQLHLNRTVVAAGIVLVLLLGLCIRLIFLQIYQHDIYKTLSLNNQVRIVPITAPRGLIFDRNGILLAENKPAFSLELTPERTPDIEATLTALSSVIPLTEPELRQFKKQLKLKRRSESVPIRVKMSEDDVAKFSVEKYRFPGVEIVARLIRHYPLGENFAHALGYIGPISEKELPTLEPSEYRGSYHIGKTGIEKFYEKVLKGSNGYQHVEADAKGRTIRVLNRFSPTPGTHIYLTIDSRLQNAAYEALNEQKGAIVAIDPNNGDVLALVTRPSYDPNLFAQGIDTDNYNILQNSPDRPLFHRAIRGQYPPGSSVKSLVALKALELGTSKDFRIFDPGYYQLNGAGRLYRDWMYHSRKHGHGWVDMDKAIKESCDTYFFTIANRMGADNLHEIYNRFDMGKLTNLDITGEAAGLNPSIAWKKNRYNQAWYGGDTLNISIGQGLMLATPLQMAHVTAILASRGKRFKPHLLHASLTHQQTLQKQEPALNIVKAMEPIVLSDNAHWDIVIQAMQKVVHEPGGTAYRISHGLKYQIAGKTGTAQVFNLKQGEKYNANLVKAHLRDHSWFIAFAPVENPKIALAVLVENADNKGHRIAKDLARIVLDNFFNADTNEKDTNPSAHTSIQILEEKNIKKNKAITSNMNDIEEEQFNDTEDEDEINKNVLDASIKDEKDEPLQENEDL